MADVVDAPTRSRMMAGIRGRDTRPEQIVRKALFARGFRYRLDVRTLPGRPDIVLAKHRAAVFVHGCFWHQHPGCRLAARPATRPVFWAAKLGRNAERDLEVRGKLLDLGWRVAVIWECGTRHASAEMVDALTAWLGGDEPTLEHPLLGTRGN
jgi:DNA mismatch endonuclease (patch repair protein)